MVSVTLIKDKPGAFVTYQRRFSSKAFLKSIDSATKDLKGKLTSRGGYIMIIVSFWKFGLISSIYAWKNQMPIDGL